MGLYDAVWSSYAVVDFTNDFSPFLVSLVSLVWFTAGMILWIAVRQYLSEKARPVVKTGSDLAGRRDAA